MRPSSAPAPRRGPRCSSTSRSSIIGTACTQPWAIARQPKPGPAWRRSLCARQPDILIAPLHSQGGSPLLDQNPLVWMVEVNGMLVDLRHMPREVQEIAFQTGMIPYIPADQEQGPERSSPNPDE